MNRFLWLLSNPEDDIGSSEFSNSNSVNYHTCNAACSYGKCRIQWSNRTARDTIWVEFESSISHQVMDSSIWQRNKLLMLRSPLDKYLHIHRTSKHERIRNRVSPLSIWMQKQSTCTCHTLLAVLLVNRMGTFRIPNVIIIVTCITLSFHCSFVSPSLRSGSTFQSRSRSVRKATASVVANLRPRHWRGPKDMC